MVFDVPLLVSVQLPLEEAVCEPRVLDHLGRTRPLLDVAVQHLQDQVLRCLRHLLPEVAAELHCSALRDALHHLEVVCPRVRRLPHQQDVQDDSQRPDVALLVVAADEDFGGDVVGLREGVGTVPTRLRGLISLD